MRCHRADSRQPFLMFSLSPVHRHRHLHCAHPPKLMRVRGRTTVLVQAHGADLVGRRGTRAGFALDRRWVAQRASATCSTLRRRRCIAGYPGLEAVLEHCQVGLLK
jgi:hypothetical protein